MNASSGALAEQLYRDGYCVARKVLDAALIAQLRDASSLALSELCEEHRQRNRSQGSLINLSDYPQFSAVIAAPALLGLLHSLNFPDPVFSSGYVISKPPQAPPLFWHQDWWGWDDPVSYRDTICQVFAMIYLTATTPSNGCLRVIPGSHRRRHALHNTETDAAHSEALSRVDDPSNSLYQPRADEQPVEVQPGDVVIGDARLLHGAYGNGSEQERTLLTLWYHPNYAVLPAGMRARIREIFLRRDVDTDPTGGDGNGSLRTLLDWPSADASRISELLPRADGLDHVAPHAWNREPDLRLMQSAER